MAFEQQQFGNGIAPGTTVGGITSNVTSRVSNHYNERDTGGEQGRFNTMGIEQESAFDFTNDSPLFDTQSVPAGAIVTDVRGYGLYRFYCYGSG